MDDDSVRDEELQAYIDGALDPDRAREVAAAVLASAALTDQVAAYRADKETLARLYRPLADRPLRRDFLAHARRAQARGRNLRIFAGAAAAAAVIAGLWFAAPSPGDRLVAEALAARVGKTHPVQEYAATAVETPAARDQLVAATLARPVKVPSLARVGYLLVAMEVYHDHALQLRYRNAEGRVFTVYLRHPAGPDRFDLLRRGNVEICLWQNEDLSVAMTGEMTPKEMLRVASLTYADLNL